MSYEFYNAYQTIALSPSQDYRNHIQQVINDQFENASDYYIVKLKDRTTGIFNDIGVRLTASYPMQQRYTIKDDFRTILFKSTDVIVYLGDIFQFNNYNWMVIDTGRLETPTNSCQVQRCNVQLKFIESSASVMPSTPVGSTLITVDGIATNQLTNVSEDKIVLLPTNQLYVKISNDLNSRKIRFTGQIGTRFLLGNPLQAWRTVGIDTITDIRPTISAISNDVNGIINLKLQFDTVNSLVDNITLGIAKQSCY